MANCSVSWVVGPLALVLTIVVLRVVVARAGTARPASQRNAEAVTQPTVDSKLLRLRICVLLMLFLACPR
jgi:hypothetical protein